jgi:hypothetical protein
MLSIVKANVTLTPIAVTLSDGINFLNTKKRENTFLSIVPHFLNSTAFWKAYRLHSCVQLKTVTCGERYV